MSTEDLKKEMRQILMLISAIRSQDNERYEAHINFSNEIVEYIKKIQEEMNTNWEKVHKSLEKLNTTIEESLDSLLTGINPEGIKETSKSLQQIMDTMGKSIQSMNLENIMRELRGLTGQGITIAAPAAGSGSKSSGAIPISTKSSSPYGAPAATSAAAPAAAAEEEEDEPIDGLSPEEIEAYKEAYGGQLPPHLLKKKKKKKDTHLLKPSDFFGM